MATFLLIRHGNTDMVGHTIAGRMSGVHLNAEGKKQAEYLAERFSGFHIDRIFSSPLERTQETATPLAERLGLSIELKESLIEVDFGEWTNCRIGELKGFPKWEQFNLFRSGTRIPGGELMVEVQRRVIAELENLREEFPEKTLAFVSHGDVIKSAIAHYAGIPLDLFLRIEISPASVSIINVNEHGPRILRINDTGRLPVP